MPEETHFLKQNDVGGVIERTLRDGFGAPADLTGATMVFSMRVKPAGSVKISAAAATLVTALAGLVRYTFTASNTDTADEYEGEFQATYSNGDVQTYPEDGYIPVKVADDIA
jgi:hypothetical protein